MSCIKNVEHLYRGKRETEVGSGGDSVVVYEEWRVNPDGDTWQDSKILKGIRDYNIDDCDSTQELVVWLRQRQLEHDIKYIGYAEVVEPEVSEEVTERTQLRDELLAEAETLREEDEKKAALVENLAWFLEFHRREAKPVFWKLFERLGLTDIELIDDLDCLACCERTERVPFKPTPKARNLAYEYRFDANQEFKLTHSKDFYVVGQETAGGKNSKVTLVKDKSELQKGLIVVQAKEEPPAIYNLSTQ